MWFKITHLPKGTCFRKLTNITFAYLLSPTMLQHFKQVFKQGCIILAQIGPKLPIFPKRYFLGKLTITFVCLLVLSYNNISKENFREQMIRKCCIILVQIWFGSIHQKRIYWKSGPKLHWSFIPIMLHNLKKIEREQIIRLHNFCPNCPLSQKGIFLEN